MNDAELLAWVEKQSYYSLQRTTMEFSHNKDFMIRLRHLRCLFPEVFPRVPRVMDLHNQFMNWIKEQE
jgi:hypothetical protein